MITIESILLQFHELSEDDLRRWITNAWVRPQGGPTHYHFQDIDLARIKLILELRDTLEVAEPALPTVLSLLDQIYEMRRHMQRLNQALETLPGNLRAGLQEASAHLPAPRHPER